MDLNCVVDEFSALKSKSKENTVDCVMFRILEEIKIMFILIVHKITICSYTIPISIKI